VSHTRKEASYYHNMLREVIIAQHFTQHTYMDWDLCGGSHPM